MKLGMQLVDPNIHAKGEKMELISVIHDTVSEKIIFIQTLSATISPVIDQGKIKLIKNLMWLMCKEATDVLYFIVFNVRLNPTSTP